MKEKNLSGFRWWLILTCVAIVGFLVFGFDPVGKVLDRSFDPFMGRSPSVWAVTLIILGIAGSLGFFKK